MELTKSAVAHYDVENDSFYNCDNLSSHFEKLFGKFPANVGSVHLQLTARLYFIFLPDTEWLDEEC